SPRCRLPRSPLSFPTRRSSDLPLTVYRKKQVIHIQTVLVGRRSPDHPGNHQAVACFLKTGTQVCLIRPGTRSHEFQTNRIKKPRSEEHTSELQSRENLVCRLLL